MRTASSAPETRLLAHATHAFLKSPPAGFADRPLLDACGLWIAVEHGARPPWLDDPDARRVSIDATRFALRARHLELIDGDVYGFPEEGRLDIVGFVQALENAACRAGVTIRKEARVRELNRTSAGVNGVRLDDGTLLSADVTVLAAGGWAGALGRTVGSPVELRPTRRHIVVSEALPSFDRRAPVVWNESAGFYSRPEGDGLLLCACDQTDIDPDACEALPAERDRTVDVARKHLTAVQDLRPARFWSGVRTLTPDDRAVVGPDPIVDGLFWVAGLGGHGMSTSIGTGRLAAQLLLRDAAERTDVAHALRPARFLDPVHG